MVTRSLFEKYRSFQLTTLHKYLIVLVFTIILGFNLAHRSDAPPYGYPTNELSNNYWGIITDIGHRWRNLDFTFWNRGVGGGMSLFSSGQYPILNPTNIFAFVFNDDHFYLFKLIEPYVLGFFFMAVLLWDVFKTRWYIALFGGFAYMGLTISKSTTIAESPYFLYGCALLPFMVLFAIKLSQRHIYLTAAGVGACLAWQFLAEGVTQMPQMLIWWFIFFSIWIGSEWLINRRKKTDHAVKTWIIAVLILMGVMLGFCGLQMIPSLHFFIYESARLPGHYPINNFDLFRNLGGTYGLAQTVFGSLLEPEPVRTKIFLVILLVCLAVAIVHFGRIFEKTLHKRFLSLFWFTTAVYFLIPNTAVLLTKFLPFLEKIFSPLTYFTFRYGLHTLDFGIVLTICLILNDERLSLIKFKKFSLRWGFAILILSLVVMMGVLPTVLFLAKNSSQWISSWPWLQHFVPGSFNKGLWILIKAIAIILILTMRPRQLFFHLTMAFILLGSGFMMLLDCYKWYDKGCQSNAQLYQLTTPEHEYFRNAKGKYILPYYPQQPEWVLDNYNLLHGVHGTAGFMALAPLRLTKFGFYFNARSQDHFETIPFVGSGSKFGRINGGAPASLTTYFPIDFTMVNRDEPLLWPGFKKVIKGEKFDVYERAQPTQRVYFADDLQIIDFFTLVSQFAEPRSNKVYVSREDAEDFSLAKTILAKGKAEYNDFIQNKENRLTFHTQTEKETFVIVPEMYQKGWHGTVDEKKVSLFPANYLFLGLKVPAGQHQIELHFSPPWFRLGLLLNILCWIGMAILFRKFWKIGKGKNKYASA